MRKYLKWISLFVFSLSTMGCAAVPEYITPHPVAQQNINRVGHGKVVSVKVVDERNDTIVGNRANDVGVGPSVNILLASDSTDKIDQAVRDGLSARGFKPVDAEHSSGSTVLKITLTRLSYEYIPATFGNYPGGTLLNSTLEVEGSHAGGHYQKTYRADFNGGLPGFADSKDRDQKLVSKILSQNINRMLFDKNLMNFLAR